MKVVSLVERSGEKRSVHVPSVSPATLRPILNKHIAKQAALMTGEAGVYKKIGKDFASHDSVNHARGEYVNCIRLWLQSNTVESSFAILKRGLVGTFHHVGEQHLQRIQLGGPDLITGGQTGGPEEAGPASKYPCGS